ncbi:hypothetical protein H6F94_18360 [Leptolyngbya sp. FACHB-261]|nr:hypothetical protein [Leptolyngbya sp. FACHB-261]
MHRTSYILAAIGSLGGAFLLCLLGIELGRQYAMRFMPNAELEGLVPPTLGGAIGIWLGAVLGCWLLLRLCAQSQAGRTAWFLSGLVLLGLVGFPVLLSFAPGSAALFMPITGLWLVVAALLARRMVLS